MIFPFGPLVNALAIVVGGFVGVLLGQRMPERVRTSVFQGLGLCVLLVGMQAAMEGKHIVITIGAVVLGVVVGELLRVEDALTRLGETLKVRLRTSNPHFTTGFLNATVIFCIGAMAILGSFEEGLRSTRSIVYAKAAIDGFAAIIMASAMGVGVLFSAVAVFVYQGALVLGAGALSTLLTPELMAELTATGGIIIMGIGLNMLEVVRIRLANFVPALFFAVLLGWLFL